MQLTMSEEEIAYNEKINTNTSPTNNEIFDRDGYLLIKDLVDPKILYRSPPKSKLRGQIKYWGKQIDQFNFIPEEIQVNGSLATYSHPQYREVHSQIRLKLESIIGKKLYNTYYYDRFYFSGQKLDKHTDRDSCEISVSVHISTNFEDCWPIWIKTPDTDDQKGENRSLCLNAGDGLIYKGCERPHWRDSLNGEKSKVFPLFKKDTEEKEDTYYHQVFFHYVLQDGRRCHYAWDMG